jgi:hypothetical protein
VVRIWLLDDHSFDERQVRSDGNTIAKELGALNLAPVVVNIFLVQPPADALGNTTLELPFNTALVDGGSSFMVPSTSIT